MKQKWTWHHITVFILTFFGFALVHVCMKAFSNVKNKFQSELTPHNSTHSILPVDLWESRHLYPDEKAADEFCGSLDSVFLFAYAIGLFISGFIGDRINLRLMLSFGMCSSAIAMIVFGFVSQIASIYSQYYYGVTYFIFGILQSTGWPTTVAIMANWFGKSARGVVFGLWSANISVGNIISSQVIVLVLKYGYEYGVLVASSLLFCGGVIMFFCLIPSPQLVGLPAANEDDRNSVLGASINRSLHELSASSDMSEEEEEAPDIKTEQPVKAINFFDAIRLPGVIPYSMAFACIKLVNYSFFFWLPLYLAQGLHWKDSTSDRLSNFYDIGVIVGATFAGIATDFIGVRSPVIVAMLSLSLGSLFWYSHVGAHYTYNVVVMTLTGILLGGPGSIIGCTVSADLGQHESIKGNAMALATVTGIVDGTGSFGAAVGQYLIGVINRRFNWIWVFYFLMLVTFMGILCLLPIFIREIRKLRKPHTYRLLTSVDT